ncbi:MAG TPA: trypsin-like peptidase domain-containing protein [Thermomicrobiaceae bacterium]|nr:trypsin-like peptidase domain-containing protein [Thermomicrobiaceae bacterium]
MSSASSEGKSLLSELSDDLAGAVERASASVVRVNARRRMGATGIVWSADGVIVSADHVIEREDDITVDLPGGRQVAARLVGRDPGTDLAALRVEAAGLTAAALSPVAPRVGALVLALGRGHGEAPMATLGVVSAVSGPWRTWRGGTLESVVRADATLYPGFSGGPLVDTEGRLIGVNSSTLARGLGVTIPHAVVSRVVEALVSQGKVRRGFLGVATQPVALPESLRGTLGLTQMSGLLLIGIEPDSPAELAGLMIGDVLVALGGQATPDLEALQDRLGPGSVGVAQPARLVRGGQFVELALTAGER